MKKTLIAAGIAAVVAAPAAFADVSVSGNVKYQYQHTATGDGGLDNSDNNLHFKASEDLGNGMTAFAQISIDADGLGTLADSSGKDQVVGLKGSFGTVMMGRFEDFSEGKIESRVTLVTDLSGNGDLESNNNAGRWNGGIAYVTPTVNGFHAGIGGYNITGSGNSAGFDAYDIAVFYDNGPISLAASQEVFKGVKGSTTGDDEKITSFAGSYTMGDLKGTVVYTKTENGGASAAGTAANDGQTDIAYKLDYTMGNNVLTLGYKDDESITGTSTGGTSTTGATATNTTAMDVWAVTATHNFSKRTQAYVGYVDYDVTDNADSKFILGMNHKF
jgi:predicted porin